ncbi:MAG: hypothetical protein K0S08_190 [Gammaproteobacteria bacterium]|jgi:uncharacterized membrane protein YccC|nr:hypothetical protein [Gammaproteobacteria bacterium]
MKLTAQWKYSLRLGVAGAVLPAVAYALNFSLPGFLWMVIAAFMVADSRVGITIRQGFHRIGGTVSGALLGTILASTFDFRSLLLVMLVFAIIGVVSAVIYNYIKTLRLTAMTAAIVYLMIITTQNSPYFPWQIGLNRAWDNTVGICIMVLVTLLIFPSTATEQWEKQVQQLIELFAKALTQMQQKFTHGKEGGATSEEIHKLIQIGCQKLQTLTQDRFWEDKLNAVSSACVAQQLSLLRLGNIISNLLQLKIPAEHNLLWDALRPLLLNVCADFQLLFSGEHLVIVAENLSKLQVSMNQLNTELEVLRAQQIIPAMQILDVQLVYRYLSLLELLFIVMMEISEQ